MIFNANKRMRRNFFFRFLSIHFSFLLSIEYLIDIRVRVYLARIIWVNILLSVVEEKKYTTQSLPSCIHTINEIENANTILIACKIYNLSDMLKRK